MNYYDNMTTKNSEEKTVNKRKLYGLVIILTIILIIFILGIVLFIFTNMNKTVSLKNITIINITIINNTYEPSFSKNVYDYYLLTEDKKIEIKCDGNKKIEGCNTQIDLNNYSNYIHEIINGDKIYKIYIKVKENDNEENIVIDSIDKNNNWINTNQVITINAKSKNDIDKYSFDNGNSWQESNVYTVENNTNLQVIVKDKYGNLSPVREVIINNIDRVNPIGIIIKEKSNSNRITLKVIAKDEESGIDSYSWNDKEYSKNDKLTISEKGTYTVKIKDKAGNVETISINIKDSDFNEKTQTTVTLYKNGSTSIGNDILSCTKNNGKCTITLPSIERENAKVIGWSSNKDDTKLEYKVNEKITVDKNMILYAITSKDIEANFEASSEIPISSTKEKCTLYNDDQYCYVNAPNIDYNSGKIIGWNTEKETLTVLKSPGNRIKLFNNQTYHALIYKEIIINFNSNGSDKISSTKEICRQQIGSDSCTIQTPNITRESSNIIGWSTNKNATNSDILANEELEVTKDSTYYAITKKTITITFNANGADSVSKDSITCSFYNNEKSCEIKTPTIARKNATIIGWSSDKNSTTKELNQNKVISVDKNKTYYAITKKDVKATFISNGADQILNNSQSCTYYNAEGGCTIKTPDINRDYWEVVGWSTNKDATTTKIKEQSDLKIKDDTKYYAITYRQVKATYHKNNADSLGNCTNPQVNGCIETCNIYNLNKSCEVKMPYIYSEGNEVQFFSLGSDPSTTIGYSPAKKISILDDITLYAIVDNRYRQNTFEIVKTKKYGYTAVETENGCPTSVYNNYYTFMDKVYKKAPYIFSAAKVTFASQNTFDATWGNYAGMTYGNAIGYRNVDIKCTNTYSDYYLQTIVHELAHSWDSHFYAQKGYYLSNSSDFISLYNKYKKASKQPLRDYAYTSSGEFVADAYAWYYFLYIDNSNQPYVIKNNLYYPNDLKNTVEKYIKIAKSGYK